MTNNWTDRARRYVQSSPQTKNLPEFAKDRLIKGIANLMRGTYKMVRQQFYASLENLVNSKEFTSGIKDAIKEIRDSVAKKDV